MTECWCSCAEKDYNVSFFALTTCPSVKPDCCDCKRSYLQFSRRLIGETSSNFWVLLPVILPGLVGPSTEWLLRHHATAAAIWDAVMICRSSIPHCFALDTTHTNETGQSLVTGLRHRDEVVLHNYGDGIIWTSSFRYRFDAQRRIIRYLEYLGRSKICNRIWHMYPIWPRAYIYTVVR